MYSRITFPMDTTNEPTERHFDIRSSSFNFSRTNAIKIVQSILKSVCGFHSPLRTKLIEKPWLGLGHLNKHGFNHNLNNCSYLEVVEVELKIHFFLYCNFHHLQDVLLKLS